MLKWIGLTGGIATGKSTVAQIIRAEGFAVINADEVAHLALLPGSPVFDDIIKTFGRDILTADGQIDRGKLGQKVFGDREARLKLENFIHPFVKRRVKQLRKELNDNGSPMAFYDVPLLFETGMSDEFDKTVVVACNEKLQMARLMSRNGLKEQEARLRIQAQLPLAQKIQRADYVIFNDDSVEKLEIEVKKVLAELLKLK